MVLGRDTARRRGGGVLTEEPEEARMGKEKISKDDGRHIIFYSFDDEGDGEDMSHEETP